MFRIMVLLLVLGIMAACSVQCGFVSAAEVLLPQQRTAYYAAEPFELAVVGLEKGAKAAVELAPTKNQALTPLKFEVAGDGSTVNSRVPAGALAPGEYAVKLDGKDTPVKVTIAAGVSDSTMLVSQTANVPDIKKGEGNFILGNAFSFGVIGPDGLPAKEPRVRTSMLNTFDNAVIADLPTIIYMYWTGYVTHKPWGTLKSWESAGEQEMMRLFNLHVAQQIRKYAPNIASVGTLDEPGLNWGRTPAGGSASGFPNWDGQQWFQRRGWKFTDNPATRDDADWMKYMTIRCGIIGESQAQARDDLRTVWPNLNFETDIYAVAVVMDGADAMNQDVNDSPTTHVFLDWGIGRDFAGTELYIEKSNRPAANVAHAMNGQLMGKAMGAPVQTVCYRLMLNAMMQAGLKSNWWLNWGAIPVADVATVNEPAKRYGPLAMEMTTGKHDVAVLWGWTELCMRQKEVAAKEASKKTGEQIKLMISALPENTAIKNKEIEISAYSISGFYRNTISYTHNTLLRAGYPAHVVHERILPTGILKNYKTLFIVGQTFEFPAETKKALADFTKRGGKIVVDAATTVKIDGASVVDVDFLKPAKAWGALYGPAEANAKDKTFKTAKEASYFLTNVYMDKATKDAVPAFKAAMKDKASKQVVITDSTDLLIDRHVAGDGELIMVLNAHQELPNITDDQEYVVWNYAPCKATFAINGVKKGSTVYAIEGTDWKRVSKVDASKSIEGDFAAGEMKLYLVAPKEPKAIKAKAKIAGSTIEVSASLDGPSMPWPVTVMVGGPNGNALYVVRRSFNAEGKYTEVFPVGANAIAGAYTVRITSPVGNLSGEAKVQYAPAAALAAAQPIADAVRVFDEKTMVKFLRSLLTEEKTGIRTPIVIATANDAQKAAAATLEQGLKARGINASVADEKSVFHRARYPRLWNPWCSLCKNEGEEKKVEGAVDVKVTVELADDGSVAAKTEDGKNLGDQWRKPKTLATIGPKGYMEYQNLDNEICYEPGCKIYVDEKNQQAVVKGTVAATKTTDELRAKYSRPWSKLASYVGGYQLPPQLPEAYEADAHLIILGDSTKGELAAALQASELLPQVVDAKYPGPGKALVEFAWWPFGLGKNVIFIGATDDAGLKAGVVKLIELAK